MSTRFFTNTGDNTLLAKFAGVFAHNPDIEWFDALVGYLRSSGYFAVRPHIEKVPHVRILVGINVDAIMADYHKRGLLFLADPTKSIEQFKETLREDIQNAAYSPEVEQGILQFIDDVVNRKIELRAHPTKRLHAKLFIFRPAGFNEHKAGAVITGSSNLTDAGLGTHGEVSNYEFNVLLHNYDDVRFATDEFERLWSESIEILPKILTGVRDRTYLASPVTPYELYYKLLLEYFGAAIEYDPNAVSDLPEGFKRLSYQIDAVAQGFRLLEKHGGFFLADVVGLGKTVIATLIAKRFFFHNGFPEHRSHTLIVVPPALRDGWEATKKAFRLDNCDIINNGSLHKVRNPESYDLIIVDEAHKFRNDTAEGFDELQRICKTKTLRVVNGERTDKRVMLVSATPLNNRPEDIRNLIALFQDLKHSTLGISNLQHFFAQREKEYRSAKKEPDIHEARRKVMAIYENIRMNVISEVIVRRTRTDLDVNEDYRRDLAEQSVSFPGIAPPKHILYPLSRGLEQLYDRTMGILSLTDGSGFTYNRYRAIAYLKPEKKARYQNAERISLQLATIMRTLLVKRLDSSFHAFRASLGRFRDATGAMVGMFKKGTIYIAPNIGVTEYLLEGREDELVALIAERELTDPTITTCTPADFEPAFLPGLEHDWKLLSGLCEEWDTFVDEDPKFDEFLACLKGELFDREINRDHKLVIFSESRETTQYLAGRLEAAGYQKVLTVDSTNRAERMAIVRANFDANTPEKKHDYDVLISTEVLAEGVNLHRANVVVNYDTPWNSTRLMQRIGRVNRIGTTATRIYIYNFYPTARVDDDIELRKKAVMKLQAFHTALGEDSQIYSVDEEVDTFGLFERTPEESERDERLALLMELRRFRRENPETFARVKALPRRARTGRIDPARSGSTVTFIRNRRRDAFYRIKGDVPPEEINLLEAAREFRAPDPEEKSVPLHSEHHAQVQSAIAAFGEAVIAGALLPQVVDAIQGPNEKRALSFLDAVLSFPFLTEEDRQRILSAKTAVRRARFQNLQRQINALQRSQKTTRNTPAVITDKLIEILRAYPLDEQQPPPAPAGDAPPPRAETDPDIILSESFDYSA
ncbi:MAG TPA: helicase-related protein [Chthoniobacteraceae bacterium]|jgi:superfamily II DNA or RNA helicase|nr:helicase-related protein [Chthoniobacteraceae bacterium]